AAAGRGIPLNPATPSIGNIFRNNGYRTVYYGKWHLGGNPVEHGWSEYKREFAGKLTNLGVSFLNSKPQEPFFLFMSYLNPHDIYHFVKEKQNIKDAENIRLPESFSDDLKDKPACQKLFMTDDQGKFINKADTQTWKAYRKYYQKKVKLVDNEIGKVLDALKKLGLADNTIIIFTSDHGDMDTAHRLVFKGPFMYEEMIRVPLIISYPGHFPEGESRSQMVQNIDLLPTLADITGITTPHNPDGESLLPVIMNKNTKSREYIITQYYAKQQWITPIRSIRTKDWKYNLCHKWGEELYDLKNDPIEMHNLADKNEYKEKKKEMRAKLEKWMKKNFDYFHQLRSTDRAGILLDV
ncbi:sulfatase-like hydrolase/transferase, partial [bacterium]|nr:sulfatase-like hydrolase/transferase [bacterium]